MAKLKIRKSGFYKDEEDEVLRFCLSDDYPRSLTIERTGTTFTLKMPSAARYLWRRIRGIARPTHEEQYHHDKDDHRILEANNIKDTFDLWGSIRNR